MVGRPPDANQLFFLLGLTTDEVGARKAFMQVHVQRQGGAWGAHTLPQEPKGPPDGTWGQGNFSK